MGWNDVVGEVPPGRPRAPAHDGERRLALPSVRWLRVLDVLKGDFGPVPVFVDARGTPRVFVVGGEDRVVIIFAAVPETILAALPGRRACEVIGHPAFAPGSHNGELAIVEAIAAAPPGQPGGGLVLTFDLPLDIAGTRDMDDLLRQEAPCLPGVGDG